MEIKNVKGGYDYLPEEQKIRNYIVDVLKKVFEEYGYNSIETPILCYYDMLSDKYDENNDILKEIYKLSDQGKRELGLRYDLTVPLAKFIALNKNVISLPFKRYEIAKVFRDGPVKPGRDREFTQCDVDAVGLKGEIIETEMMTMFARVFDELGIDVVIKYNNRKLMSGLIEECEIKEKLVPSVTTVIDKMEKIPKEEMRLFLENLGVESAKMNRILEIFSYSFDDLMEKFGNTQNEKLKEGLEEVSSLKSYIEEIGLGSKCLFVSSLARGQNYYTGSVFEVYDANKNLTCSIAGGGRYDEMIGNFIADGESYPAVGISFGLAPIYELLKDRTLWRQKNRVEFYLIPLGKAIECIKLANEIRKLGCTVDVEMQHRKLKKSLDYANRQNIPYVIIMGEEEFSKGLINIRVMSENRTVSLPIERLSRITDMKDL